MSSHRPNINEKLLKRTFNIGCHPSIHPFDNKITSAIQINGSTGEWMTPSLTHPLPLFFLERIMSDALEKLDDTGSRTIISLPYEDDKDALAQEG